MLGSHGAEDVGYSLQDCDAVERPHGVTIQNTTVHTT
jgi:hypothetical protein